MQRILITTIVSWLFCLSSIAAMYYVRTDGNNSNDGLDNTAGGAWLTVQHAEDTIQAGDTVLIQAGTYDETVTVNTVDGSAGNYRRFRGVGPTTIVKRFVVQDAYTWIGDLKIYNSTVGDEGISLYSGGDNSVISNCVVECKGIGIRFIYSACPDSVTIVGNLVTNCQSGIYVCGDSASGDLVTSNTVTRLRAWAAGDNDYMRVLGGGNHVITWNLSYGNSTNDLDTTGAGYSHIDGIQTYNGEQTWPATNVVVAHNIILDAMTGIQFTDLSSGGFGGWIITNNVIGRGFPIFFTGQLQGQSPFNWTSVKGNNVILHNTWFGMGAGAVFDNCTSANVTNNISLNCGIGYKFDGTTPQTGGDYNCIYPSASPDAGAHDINSNPLVVNAANPLGADGLPWTADDGLRLTSGSPAIVPNGLDWGAYEITNSVVQPPATQKLRGKSKNRGNTISH